MGNRHYCEPRSGKFSEHRQDDLYLMIGKENHPIPNALRISYKSTALDSTYCHCLVCGWMYLNQDS